VDDELFDLLASRVGALGLDLVDLEVRAGMVKVTVDRDGGADIESIADATRAISRFLDDHDPQPGRRYTLEVSTPGVERPLRSPSSFARAVGETVSVRTVSGGEGERRFQGLLAAADDEGFVLQSASSPSSPTGERRFSYEEVERARTVFEWPKGGSSARAKGAGTGSQRGARRRPKVSERVTAP
jgi:ribosome maturation factor RimP